jgi:hypothetical protein
MGAHGLSEFGRTAVHAVAVEQLSTKFLFQSPDRIAQRWLRDAAPFGCAGEVLFPAKRQEVSDLMQFH